MPSIRRTLPIVLAIALVAAVAVAGGAHEAGANAPDAYVSLGDSFTAGPVIPAYAEPWGCLKSTNNYPNHVAPQLGLSVFRDVSCSGAETEDMAEPQGVSPGPNPPQFDALGADVAVVTVQIGGNDIGFSSIAEDCFSPTPLGQPCQDTYVVGGRDVLAERIAAAAPSVRAVFDGIRDRAPQANVFALNYPAIFPHTGPGTHCYPQLPIAWADIPYLRGVQEGLNAMIAEQAAASGVALVDVYAASVGHDACQIPGLRWVEPAVPAGPAAPVHPNLIGMLAMADVVAAQVLAA